MAKASAKPRNSQVLCVELKSTPRSSWMLKVNWPGDVPGHEGRGQHRDQHEQAADHRVDDEGERGPRPPRPAPHPDQEVERDEHRLPEDVEEHQVAGGEEPEQPGLGQQQAGEVAPGALRRAHAAGHDGQEEERRGQQQEPDRDAVHADVPGQAHLARPALVVDELQARGPAVEDPDQHAGERQRPQGGHDGEDARLHHVALGHGQHRQGAHQGQQHDGRDPRHQCSTRTKTTPTSTRPATTAKA